MSFDEKWTMCLEMGPFWDSFEMGKYKFYFVSLGVSVGDSVLN